MAALLGLLGLLVGGIINHVGADLAHRRRLGPPRCAYCRSPRPWRQWLALPASVIRHDACPSCGAPIPPRHALIEVGLAATYAYLWIALGPSLRIALFALYGAILGLILATDLERHLIPNMVIYPALAVAAAAAFFTPGLTPWRALIGGVVGFVAFLIMALVGRALYGPQALGPGEVKLAAFAGLITGFPLVLVVIAVTILTAGTTSLVLLLARIQGRRDALPYAPFLVAGIAIAALWGAPIVEAVLSPGP